jgi:hypothetical protein
MSSDGFRVREEQLRELIDENLVSVAGSRERAQAEQLWPSLETLVVDRSENPELHEAGLAEQLAWYVYILGTSGCVEMPRGIPPHGLLGYAVRGPERNEALIIQVYCEDGPRVNSGPLGADELIDPGPADGYERVVEELVVTARRIAEIATELLPAARAAAVVRS